MCTYSINCVMCAQSLLTVLCVNSTLTVCSYVDTALTVCCVHTQHLMCFVCTYSFNFTRNKVGNIQVKHNKVLNYLFYRRCISETGSRIYDMYTINNLILCCVWLVYYPLYFLDHKHKGNDSLKEF